MKNLFEVRGDLTAIIINSPKYGRKKVIIDTADLQRVKDFPNTWVVKRDPTINDFYCGGKIQDINGKRVQIYLHRWLTRCPKYLQVDHFDNNPLNNRRSNLRVVTNAENQQNPKGAQRNSSSGILGVHWNSQTRKWKAHIEVNGKKNYIGSFASVDEASMAIELSRVKMMPFSKDAIRLKEKA